MRAGGFRFTAASMAALQEVSHIELLLFFGFPAIVEAFGVLREVLKEVSE